MAVVDAARVVAQGVQLIDRASCGAEAVGAGRGWAPARLPFCCSQGLPTRLTGFVAGKIPQTQALQREVHTYRTFLDGASGGGKPIKI